MRYRKLAASTFRVQIARLEPSDDCALRIASDAVRASLCSLAFRSAHVHPVSNARRSNRPTHSPADTRHPCAHPCASLAWQVLRPGGPHRVAHKATLERGLTRIVCFGSQTCNFDVLYAYLVRCALKQTTCHTHAVLTPNGSHLQQTCGNYDFNYDRGLLALSCSHIQKHRRPPKCSLLRLVQQATSSFAPSATCAWPCVRL